MLYLLKSRLISTSMKGFTYKVGYSSNFTARKYSYVCANPGVEIVSTREGDTELEYCIHIYLSFLGLNRSSLREWFISDDRVVDIFHYTEERLHRLIWKNRDNIFGLKSTKLFPTELELYFKLRDKYFPDLLTKQYKHKNQKVYEYKYKRIDLEMLKRYPDRFKTENQSPILEKEKIAQDFLDNQFYTTGFFHERMRMYCDFMDKYSGDPEIELIIYNLVKDERFKTYYGSFGTSGCSSSKYMYKPLLNKVYDLSKEDQLRQAIYTNFKAGNRLTKKDIKSKLSDIHRDLGITRKAKATDLKLYFKLKPITLYINSKSENGFELKSLV